MDRTKEKEVGSPRFSIKKLAVYLFLLIASLASLFPFYYMFVMATRLNREINQVPPPFTPGRDLVNNFQKVLDNIDFFGAMWNSLVVSTSVTIGTLFLCSLAGYAFAKLAFKGKNVLFVFILITMMVPPQLGLIPQYYIITELGWLNDYRAIIVPGLINAFGIFWMRQYIKEGVPTELIEAARMDGCSTFRIYWNIVVPMILPAFATLGIIVFMQVWNDFLWPLVVLRDPSMHTLQVALRSLNDARQMDYGMIMSGTFWATVPLIIVFLLFNRLFIDSLSEGAVKS
ncbi:carbohydrate ABC transporter permease [Halalkalibacterium halodurans]|uniref:Sugar transport system (Permease) n=2 Tax=Halalkalibacterium halodurans TaxID=86665 RepID=Q9KBK0_HALH5|nr:carbohydrate ABC transporter permease [Halalkalibacterium halodurans]MDY7222487.1 carbohydrate ABC transporter permease [Halalkalibacterium halodurans]MDY7241708.1 carbohydrate ABC transporter permease [Halalkalibacterium halodurans]MED4082687.1 carbohydrate ABC transporter permease [Halalkalibacterium halodurans]MED4085887.1 carbohydrate ABC transporter permease [Halalkalibacterium halodurans]MED4106855.1 carbohydrate ABC transporter permease [Halalkalibacterium halodurans]